MKLESNADDIEETHVQKVHPLLFRAYTWPQCNRGLVTALSSSSAHRLAQRPPRVKNRSQVPQGLPLPSTHLREARFSPTPQPKQHITTE